MVFFQLSKGPKRRPVTAIDTRALQPFQLPAQQKAVPCCRGKSWVCVFLQNPPEWSGLPFWRAARHGFELSFFRYFTNAGPMAGPSVCKTYSAKATILFQPLKCDHPFGFAKQGQSVKMQKPGPIVVFLFCFLKFPPWFLLRACAVHLPRQEGPLTQENWQMLSKLVRDIPGGGGGVKGAYKQVIHDEYSLLGVPECQMIFGTCQFG